MTSSARCDRCNLTAWAHQPTFRYYRRRGGLRDIPQIRLYCITDHAVHRLVDAFDARRGRWRRGRLMLGRSRRLRPRLPTEEMSLVAQFLGGTLKGSSYDPPLHI